VTDNGNYYVNLYFSKPIENLKKASEQITQTIGVVEHGLFLNMASLCLVGTLDGMVKTLKPNK